MIIRFSPKHGGDKFKVFVFCVGPYKVTISSYIHVIKQLLNEVEYVWCEQLCRSRRIIPSIGYCLHLPNMATVCWLWRFSRGTEDNQKRWNILNEYNNWEEIEDITWPLGDTNFIFSCWKYLSRVSEANEWEILSAREDKIRIPKRPCNVQNSSIKVVTYHKMPVAKMLWNLDIKL